jgi:cell division protein FtsI (penicillin-binding protein 3)
LGATSYLLDKLDIDTENDVDDSEDEKIWGKTTGEEGKFSFVPREIGKNRVPDVRGMGAKDAVYLLKQAGLRVGLSGYGRVISQSLAAGQAVQKGAYVHITLKP